MSAKDKEEKEVSDARVGDTLFIITSEDSYSDDSCYTKEEVEEQLRDGEIDDDDIVIEVVVKKRLRAQTPPQKLVEISK